MIIQQLIYIKLNMRKFVLFTLLFILIFIPAATWAFDKPSRILAPELNGISCVSDFICLEDKSRLKDAKKLRANSLSLFTISNHLPIYQRQFSKIQINQNY